MTAPTAHPVVRLDGGVGYCMRDDRVDDCFRCALCTAIQVPPDQVPDLRIGRRIERGDALETVSGESWERVVRWLDSRGLALWYHEDVPVERDRWIGVCAVAHVDPLEPVEREDPSAFLDHCLVMSGPRLVFDPAAGLSAGDMLPRPWRLRDITYGLSIEPKGGG